MTSQRRGLGRGLDSLIPGISGRPDDAGVASVDIDALEPNPLQPRSEWDENDLDELAASIAEHGVIQPLIVTHGTGATPYQIIAGERRWRAARRAGLSSIPVLIREVSTLEALEIALVENVQRADLNAIEEALAYRHLTDEFGLTQEQIASRVGRSRSAIANTLRLLDAPKVVRTAVVTGQISAGHARALLSIADRDKQEEALNRITTEGLNVRQTEQLVRRLDTQPSRRGDTASKKLSPDEQAVQDRLQHALGTKVELKPGRNGGRIVVHYYSNDDLTALLNSMERNPDA
ncbi:MAG: ParB/RepB/Spo0J family partition protein [Chloroflexota bacterium]